MEETVKALLVNILVGVVMSSIVGLFAWLGIIYGNEKTWWADKTIFGKAILVLVIIAGICGFALIKLLNLSMLIWSKYGVKTKRGID